MAVVRHRRFGLCSLLWGDLKTYVSVLPDFWVKLALHTLGNLGLHADLVTYPQIKHVDSTFTYQRDQGEDLFHFTLSHLAAIHPAQVI